ncbi:MlaE family lipid ABC transporter permease subunit [Marinilabilia sp.]|uniref:ABC transporter permease n=1 Tax=Marinilabilia sp. TaxID=2021252 RepID=UPI0025BB1C27|nr:MlaE family lipid ABC transporter permease subunit [Marinilabilia sp.]
MKQKKTHKSAFFSVKGNVIHVLGDLKINNTATFLNDIAIFFRANPGSDFSLDLSGIEELDSSGAMALHSLHQTAKKFHITLNLREASPETKNKLELFSPVSNKTMQPGKHGPFFYSLGDKTMWILKEYVVTFFYLVSDILFWSVRDIFNSKQRRKGEFINQAVSIGVNALPIVASMAFIIGLVLALQSSSQLRNFGANIYIVDLTVIAMMAEMGPLITAILVAGRSGSSIAAEIATMKVTSEIDALKTMGLNPLRFVVVPKIYGSLITLPFLTILASISGIAGGALAAYLYLDITPEIFFNRMPEALYEKDIITSFIKSIVFALIIVITGTFFGFKVEEGAEGVGRSTTSSVVAAITMVIIADSILGLMFY